jgi:iron-sulfur cluster repair protein YtfE (RIC family)
MLQNQAAVEQQRVSRYLGDDHVAIDRLLADARRMIDDGEGERAEDAFREAGQRLRLHIRIEEEILFPLFEERTHMQGPTMVMRAEHRAIERTLAQIAEALGLGQLRVAARAYDDLFDMLGAHNRKEEGVLYPRTDAALNAAERAHVIGRMRRF